MDLPWNREKRGGFFFEEKEMSRLLDHLISYLVELHEGEILQPARPKLTLLTLLPANDK